MKKKLLILAAAFLLLAGCGDQKTPEVSDVAKGLSTDLNYTDTLIEMDKDTAIKVHGLSADYIDSIAGYINSGSSTEEILVLKINDHSEQPAYDALSDYVDQQKVAVKDYQPEQYKLMETNTYLSKQGKYVILCISADDTKTTEKAALKYFE